MPVSLLFLNENREMLFLSRFKKSHPPTKPKVAFHWSLFNPAHRGAVSTHFLKYHERIADSI